MDKFELDKKIKGEFVTLQDHVGVDLRIKVVSRSKKVRESNRRMKGYKWHDPCGNFFRLISILFKISLLSPLSSSHLTSIISSQVHQLTSAEIRVLV